MNPISAAGLIFATCLILAAFAQTTFGDRQGGKRGHQPPNSNQRVEQLDRFLNLSDDQKVKLRSVFDDEEGQIQALRSDTSLSPREKKAKLQQIQWQTQAQIRQTLNPEQLKRFDRRREKSRERNSHKGRGRYRRQ